MSELEYIIEHFEERFRKYKGRRIALYAGEYLTDIRDHFDPEYHFSCVLGAECDTVPAGIEVVVLTARRTGKEPDYNRICESCAENGVLLLDLFGIDQIELHRELKDQKHITIAKWRELLADYDVVSMLVSNVVEEFDEGRNEWKLRRGFVVIYDWLKSNNKTVYLFWDEESQKEPLGILHETGTFISKREGNNELAFMRMADEHAGERIIHIGVGTVRDGIVPREYGIDSHLMRYFIRKEAYPSSSEDTVIDKQVLLDAIDSHDIISFDIFDTLLNRIVMYPKDVFEIIEKKTEIEGFADRRYEIQISYPHCSLNDIYSMLGDMYGYDEKTLGTLRSEELKLETDLIIPRESIVSILDYAKSRNKEVVLVSDMYLDEEYVETLLERNGITGYKKILISCKYDQLKHEGLFNELIKEYKGESILHIGDDYYSDFISAQESGLDVFYVPSCLESAKENGYSHIIEMCSTLAERKMMGLALALAFDDPFSANNDLRIACMIAAPLILGYLQWVCSEMNGKGYDYYLLSARDGALLVDIYSRIRKNDPLDLPPAKYLYISRHAAYLTIMDDFRMASDFINFDKYRSDPKKLIHSIFNIPLSEMKPYGDESLEEYYDANLEAISRAADRYRGNYKRYLEREGLSASKCAIMDFVSEGSSQMMLENKVSERWDGYYFGIPEYMSKFSANISYYLDSDHMDYNTEMKLEVYFTSGEPAVDYIDDNGKPAFCNEIRTKEYLERIGQVHKYVKTFTDMYLKRLYSYGEVVDRGMIFKLCSIVNRYETENNYYDDLNRSAINTIV